MPLQIPFPIQHSSITYGADIFNELLATLFSPGVIGAADLAVTQKFSGANLSVDVDNGAALVAFTSPTAGGTRQTKLTGGPSNSGTPGAPGSDWLTTFTTPHGSLPRVDRVVLTIQDSNFDASGQYRAVLRVIAGTATSGATLTNLSGAAAVPVNSLLLANVLVAAGATSISNAQISDQRVRANVGGGRSVGLGAPTGSIQPYGGSSAPSGWLITDGAAVSRTTYAPLFSVLGTAYGAGNGSTTFNLPNLRGRTLVGLDAAQSEFQSLGQTGGIKTHALSMSEMPSHNHGGGSHGHSFNVTPARILGNNTGARFGGTSEFNDSLASDVSINGSGTIIGTEGGNAAHPNLQPYAVVNWIIRT
jgi:microcystin-dependent protein